LATKAIPGTLQEGGAPFQTTHWTVILQAGQAEADESARKALATFSETYWRISIRSFDVVATRRPTRKISSKVSFFIYLNTTR